MDMDDRKRFTAESALPACRRRAQVAAFIRSERTHLVFVDRLSPDGNGRTCREDHRAS
jgi:hypothetical protein